MLKSGWVSCEMGYTRDLKNWGRELQKLYYSTVAVILDGWVVFLKMLFLIF
jgi:hypothetical protein